MRCFYFFILPCLLLTDCNSPSPDTAKIVITQTDTCKTYAGPVFTPGSPYHITLSFSKNGAPVKLRFYKWGELELVDSIYMTGFYKDSLLDVDNDGQDEFVVYCLAGMSQFKNYLLSCYAPDPVSGRIVRRGFWDTLPNPRFFKGQDYFTTLAVSRDEKVASRYEWQKKMPVLKERILISYSAANDSCQAEQYEFVNGKAEPVIKNTCELDSIYGVGW